MTVDRGLDLAQPDDLQQSRNGPKGNIALTARCGVLSPVDLARAGIPDASNDH
jgi:hypothetical protein